MMSFLRALTDVNTSARTRWRERPSRRRIVPTPAYKPHVATYPFIFGCRGCGVCVCVCALGLVRRPPALLQCSSAFHWLTLRLYLYAARHLTEKHKSLPLSKEGRERSPARKEVEMDGKWMGESWRAHKGSIIGNTPHHTHTHMDVMCMNRCCLLTVQLTPDRISTLSYRTELHRRLHEVHGVCVLHSVT